MSIKQSPGLVVIFILAMAAVAIGANWYLEGRQIAKSTEYVGTLYGGQHISYSCDDGTYFIMLLKTSSQKAVVLSGYTDQHVQEHTFIRPYASVEGCKVLKVVEDPSSNYMLEIYQRP